MPRSRPETRQSPNETLGEDENSILPFWHHKTQRKKKKIFLGIREGNHVNLIWFWNGGGTGYTRHPRDALTALIDEPQNSGAKFVLITVLIRPCSGAEVGYPTR